MDVTTACMADKMPKGDAKDYFLRNYWFETYDEISDATGWSKSTIQRWKREADLPKKNEYNRVEHTHGVSMERVLYHLHRDARMSTPEMADALNVHRPQIKKWFESTDVEKRGRSEAERVKWDKYDAEEHEKRVEQLPDEFWEKAKGKGHALFRTNYNGYESWRANYNNGETDYIKVHRLLAVAKYGVEEVKGMDVHHIKPIPWLNTYANVTLERPAEHARKHYQDREIDAQGRFK